MTLTLTPRPCAAISASATSVERCPSVNSNITNRISPPALAARISLMSWSMTADC